MSLFVDDVSGSFRFRHREVASKAEIDVMIEDSQQCLDHEHGPMFAADFFDFGEDQFAFLTAHHIVIDLVSWRLLLEELEEILRGGDLLPPALPFQKWAELQAEHAEALEFGKVLPPVDVPELDFDYWGIQREENTYGNASHALFELDSNVSSAFLTSCHVAYKTEPVELLLASLIHSWSRVFVDRPIPAIFNEGHGREPWSSEIDISRTVGWFTACKCNLHLLLAEEQCVRGCPICPCWSRLIVRLQGIPRSKTAPHHPVDMDTMILRHHGCTRR
jgi:hypothetical protein